MKELEQQPSSSSPPSDIITGMEMVLVEKRAISISELQQLTILNVSSNNIGDEGSKYISILKLLTNLNISYNKLSEKGATSISQLTQLTILDISNNQIGDIGIIIISNELKQLNNLNISSSDISNKGAVSLSNELKQLTELNISYNIKIGLIGFLSIINELNNLTLLNASNCKIGKIVPSSFNTTGGGDSDDGIVGSNSSTELSKLTHLNLSFNYIDEDICNVLVSCGLKQVPLTYLNISHNDIKIPKSISNHLKQLTELHISFNNIGNEGAVAISSTKMKKLTHLNISWNDIDKKAIQTIKNELKQQLKYLDSSYNDNTFKIKK